ncbi:MAG: hypothetical protein ACKPJJ_08630, partial [Planctomycetaceae bacterium]
MGCLQQAVPFQLKPHIQDFGLFHFERHLLSFVPAPPDQCGRQQYDRPAFGQFQPQLGIADELAATEPAHGFEAVAANNGGRWSDADGAASEKVTPEKLRRIKLFR